MQRCPERANKHLNAQSVKDADQTASWVKSMIYAWHLMGPLTKTWLLAIMAAASLVRVHLPDGQAILARQI